MSSSTGALFTELDSAISGGDHALVLRAAEKILAVDAADVDARRARAVALLHVDRHDDVATLGDADDARDELLFERCYAAYRQHNVDEASRLLARARASSSSIDVDASLRWLHLEAQVLYRRERPADALTVYERLLALREKNASAGDGGDDAMTMELLTNQLAALAAAGRAEDAAQLHAAHSSLATFETMYNLACAALSRGRFAQAAALLERAERLGESSLADDGASAAEIADELAIVRVQLGFVRQQLHDRRRAESLFRTVAEHKPADDAVYAVACNNIVALHGDRDLFDSKNKLEHAAKVDARKLSHAQQLAVAMNRALLALRMKKLDACRRELDDVERAFPSSHLPALTRAALLYRERKIDDAERVLAQLEEQSSSSSSSSVAADHARLALAHIALDARSDPAAAAAQLQRVASLRGLPAMVATLVFLFSQSLNDDDAALRVMDDAVAQWLDKLKRRASSSSSAAGAAGDSVEVEEQCLRLLRRSAAVKMRLHRYREAAADYERIIKLKPTDVDAVPALVIAYSHVDPVAAEDAARRLGDLDLNADGIDGEALEQSFSVFKPPASKRKEPSPEELKRKREEEEAAERAAKAAADAAAAQAEVDAAAAAAAAAAADAAADADADADAEQKESKAARKKKAAAAAAAAAAEKGVTPKKTLEEKLEAKRQRKLEKNRKRRQKRVNNFNPDFKPDPERWLPKWERSSYARKRKKMGLRSGASQGGAVLDAVHKDEREAEERRKAEEAEKKRVAEEAERKREADRKAEQERQRAQQQAASAKKGGGRGKKGRR